MKNVGRGPLGRGEAGVKVGDDDLGQMTSKSGEKTFLSRDEIFHVQSRGCESDGKDSYELWTTAVLRTLACMPQILILDCIFSSFLKDDFQIISE